MASVMLAALLFRAYIPVGFMPASGTPFLLELCPAAGAMPNGPQHHHHHPQGPAHAPSHVHFENCPFGSAPAAGPVSQLVVYQAPGPGPSFVSPSVIPPRLSAQPLRTHQPRGPPEAV